MSMSWGPRGSTPLLLEDGTLIATGPGQPAKGAAVSQSSVVLCCAALIEYPRLRGLLFYVP